MSKNETLRTIYFEDLSVMEIISYFGKQFCDKKFEYVRFGKDLRKAWDALAKNEAHYDAICKELGLNTDTSKELLEVAKQLHKHLDKNIVSVKDVNDKLKGHIPDEWFLFKKMTPEQDTAQFNLFMNELYHHLKAQFKVNADTWKMKLERRKKGRN